MGRSQGGASIPAKIGEVDKPEGGEHAGHRAGCPKEETAGCGAGTPAGAKERRRFQNGVIFLFPGTKVAAHADL